jgi:RNA polymerase sigma-70 factor (ECF subfamily)
MSDLRSQIVAEMPRLRRLARALARNAEIADDMVQDTLFRALRAESRWTGTDARPWLITILLNVNRNRLRSLSRHGIPVDVSEVDNQSPPPGPREEGIDIGRGLDRLNPDQREVLLLVALEGLSYEDCAKVLSIPVGTVMSRLSRAREALRDYLQGGSPNPGQRSLRVVK